MADYAIPVRDQAYIIMVSLRSQANTKLFQSNPTLAAGDVKVQTDDGSLANITTLPTGAASSLRVKVSLSASEMGGDNIWVQFSDAAGAEWCDLTLCIQTAARGIDDLAFPTVAGRSIDVTVGGDVVADSVTNPVQASLTASGMDNVDIEGGIVASALLTNDSGAQLTSINARRALALILSTASSGVLAGAATTNITTKPGGLPAGNTRVSATVDADGNRSALTLKVPD